MIHFTSVISICLLFSTINAYIKIESDGVIDSLLKSIAQKDWRNSLQLDEVNVKAKNVNITGLKNVYRSGPSTWTKNYEGSGNNWDYMNLTLSAGISNIIL